MDRISCSKGDGFRLRCGFQDAELPMIPGPLRQFTLAAADRTAGTLSQVRIPFRRAGFGRKIRTCRNSVAALQLAAH